MAGFVNQGIVDQYEKDLEGSSGFILTEFKGTRVADIERFRREVFREGGQCRVVKNRLLKIALQRHSIEGIEANCSGSTVVVLLGEYPIAIAKVVKSYEEEIEFIKIKVGYLDGQVLDSARVVEFASISSREALLAKVLMCMNAPASGFVNVLGGVLRNAVGVIKAIKDKKENE
jgi:ribosomal protein L10